MTPAAAIAASAVVRRLVEAELHATCAEYDMTDLVGLLEVAERWEERTEDVRGHVEVVRIACVDGTERPLRLNVPVETDSAETTYDAIQRASVRTFALQHVRRHARLRAMGATTDPGANAPPWSLTMHRLCRTWLLEAGVDLLLAADAADTAKRFILQDLLRQTGVTLNSTVVRDGHVSISLQGGDWNGPELTMRPSGAMPRLSVMADLPATAIAALGGRRLSMVVDHPAVRRADRIRIASAEQTEGWLMLGLEDVRDPLRRPPAGTDRAWIRLHEAFGTGQGT